MKGAAACLTALSLLVAVPAAACTPPPGWPRTVRLDVPLIARTLVDAATTIDIVVAERTTDDYEVGTTPQANAEAMANYSSGQGGLKLTATQVSAKLKEDEIPDGARIHYRVIERLKGTGQDSFSLNGMLEEAGLGSRRMSAMTQLRMRLNSRDFSDWQGFGACIQPLWTSLGRRYVVFRDAEGQLLRQVVPTRLNGQTSVIQGPVYVGVGSSGEDAWLKAIRQALASPH